MSAEQARLAALGGAQPEAPVPTPEAESAPSAAGLTVGEIIERFLDSSMAVRKRTLREATRQGYRYALKPGRRTDHLRELRKLPLPS